ncbi:hypothetical protein AB0C18_02690 [Nonomuraea muscovyensis]
MTDTAGSSALIGYHGNRPPAGPSTVPLGLARFADDFFPSIRPLAERDHSAIMHWNTYDKGGHHAAQEEPQLLADDIRAFFAGRR